MVSRFMPTSRKSVRIHRGMFVIISVIFSSSFASARSHRSLSYITLGARIWIARKDAALEFLPWFSRARPLHASGPRPLCTDSVV